MVKDGNLHHIGFAVTDIQETANLFVKNGYECRKRSIPTHSERLNPPTIIAKMALKSA